MLGFPVIFVNDFSRFFMLLYGFSMVSHIFDIYIVLMLLFIK